MIITHASFNKITEVTKDMDVPFLKGCLCFGNEGNEYNLSACNYQYNIEVDNIIDTKSFFYRHDVDEKAVQEVFQQVRKDLGLLDVDDDVIAQLLDESISVWDNDFNYSHSYDDDGEASWAIQQYQGILAHKLGYDCARSTDEQGTVYIAYCVGRPLLEVPCE
ncbi:hypothetical protein [Providencia sp. PROV197]|uniref:hypothetical protein n=1 Tax=Providencia sp. PROV197 TaxID=2949898 RepID=UPI0023495338|nr:hypothetical protein [Providencia sp. PROV197]